MEPSTNDPKLRTRLQLEKEAADLLHSEGVNPVAPIVTGKVGDCSRGNVPLTTNVYGITSGAMIPVYRFDVKIEVTHRNREGVEKVIDLARKVLNDSVNVEHRDRCRDIFIVFQRDHADFFKESKCVYFDLRSIMYSVIQLDVPQNSARKFVISGEKLPSVFSSVVKCEIEIRRVTEDFELTIGDLSKLCNDLSLTDHSLSQFLDLATSQHVLFAPDKYVAMSCGTSYLLEPNNYGFTLNDGAFFEENGSYLAIGLQKSVRFMEGPKRGRNAALILEPKKTPFHVVESLLKKVERMVRNIHNLSAMDLEKIGKICNGISIETRHLDHTQRYFIRGFDPEPATQKTIVVDGDPMTIQNFFRKKYNIDLQEPNLPLVITRGKDNNISHLPIELCFVSDNQRIKMTQQTPKQIQETIKKCAVSPTKLLPQIRQLYESMEFSESDYLKNANLNVLCNPVNLKAHTIDRPDLEFSERFIGKFRPDFTWQGRQYLIPSACTNWAAYAFLSDRDKLEDRDFNAFLKRFVNEAINKGLALSDPVKVKILRSDVKTLRRELEDAKSANAQFVLVIHSEFADDIHSYLKLCERQFSVVTQALKFNTLMNIIIKGQVLTLQNIVNKTNIKLGGLNYSLSLKTPGAREVLKRNILYIGFGMNHPVGGTGMDPEDLSLERNKGKTAVPSVIGYASNTGLVDDFEFLGDFLFQQPLRDEKTTVIRMIVRRCVEKYRVNRNVNPSQIILYRNGCSEGNFSMILSYEVPLIKAELRNIQCDAKLVIIVANKLQSVRFVPSDADPRAKSADQNIKPGTVIDHTVVHPIFNEFFLNSHRALQGTARTPKYTILFDEVGYKLAEIEQMTYFLCYGHQIVNMPTSLPSPVYIALRYASRGRMLYNKWINASDSDHSTVSYMDMSETLGYFNCLELGNRRVNA